MLQKLKQRKGQDGFTIIEVLIVLAIAGLIMLVVFLAVPALQRNSRNTQRKGDVQALLGGVTEFMANNNGQIPAAFDAAGQKITGAATDTPAGVKVGYYSSTAAFAVGTAATVKVGPWTANIAATADNVQVYVGAKCGAVGTAQGAIAGSARQVAAIYQTEATGTPVATCQES